MTSYGAKDLKEAKTKLALQEDPVLILPRQVVEMENRVRMLHEEDSMLRECATTVDTSDASELLSSDNLALSRPTVGAVAMRTSQECAISFFRHTEMPRSRQFVISSRFSR